MRYTFNLKKAYDDYYLYSPNTVYGTGERPRSEYVSPYKENLYIPEHNITKRMCYNKLGQYEDIDESPEHLAKVSEALEIAKKKRLNLNTFLRINSSVSYSFYLGNHNVLWYGMTSEALTQEEFYLLKEVLL